MSERRHSFFFQGKTRIDRHQRNSDAAGDSGTLFITGFYEFFPRFDSNSRDINLIATMKIVVQALSVIAFSPDNLQR